MKKAYAEEVIIWTCPYKNCGRENQEYGELGYYTYEKNPTECERCRKKVQLTDK